MDLFEELKERGLIFQTTNESLLKNYLNQKDAVFYVGFDPTAPSLHIGHLLLITFIKRLKNRGLKPIILIGGGTGLIGDPSGKIKERAINPEEKVKKWAKSLRKQFLKFFNFSKSSNSNLPNPILIDNYKWLKNLKVINFLRKIGKYFTINEMLNKEAVKNRLETGISFTEFSYMLLQAIDFLELYNRFNCKLQIGGSDQWGNIITGIELIKKIKNKEAIGLTLPLLIKADGTKFGKTEEGTIWLNPKLTTPYAFYQFWINTDDRDVIKFLKYFTFLNIEQINELERNLKNQPEKREAQKALAKEMTIFVHGEDAYLRANKISQILFYGNVKELKKDELEEIFNSVKLENIKISKSINVLDFLVLTKALPSKRQAREDIENKAIEINGKKIINTNQNIKKEDALCNKYFIIKRGKKSFYFAKIKN